jgi:hypothetical protein
MKALKICGPHPLVQCLNWLLILIRRRAGRGHSVTGVSSVPDGGSGSRLAGGSAARTSAAVARWEDGRRVRRQGSADSVSCAGSPDSRMSSLEVVTSIDTIRGGLVYEN